MKGREASYGIEHTWRLRREGFAELLRSKGYKVEPQYSRWGSKRVGALCLYVTVWKTFRHHVVARCSLLEPMAPAKTGLSFPMPPPNHKLYHRGPRIGARFLPKKDPQEPEPADVTDLTAYRRKRAPIRVKCLTILIDAAREAAEKGSGSDPELNP